jgi:hypothetical protein
MNIHYDILRTLFRSANIRLDPSEVALSWKRNEVASIWHPICGSASLKRLCFFSTCPGLSFVGRMFGPVDISGKVVQVVAV